MIKHYTKLADIDIPLVVYNVPGRTGQNLAPDLVVELARHPNIVGSRKRAGMFRRSPAIIEGTLDEDFMVMSGDDNLTLPILCLGGSGVISVAANVEPARMVSMFDHFCEGELEEALEQH